MVEDQIDELADMVHGAGRIVVFTGAGISTECGVPDFRSPGGLWTQFTPMSFQDFLASEKNRLEAWRRYAFIHASFRNAKPGKGHEAISELFRLGKASHVITQNIDDLHRISGVPAERIIELHGNGTYAACLDCRRRHELDCVQAHISATGTPPYCVACGGPVKSATIAFGQPMPEQAMAQARAATLDADLFLALGSSLQVFPAAGFPVLASQNRTPLVIVNREPTGLDGLAQLVINAELGDALSRLMARITLRNLADLKRRNVH